MSQVFTQLNYLFKHNDPTLGKEVDEFFQKTIPEFFTFGNTNIKVGYIDARSIVNSGGSYNKLFKQLANYSSMVETWQEEKQRQVVYMEILEQFSGSTFNSLASAVRKLLVNLRFANQHNMWNIVFYDHYDVRNL